jgi:hypothetical protein
MGKHPFFSFFRKLQLRIFSSSLAENNHYPAVALDSLIRNRFGYNSEKPFNNQKPSAKERRRKSEVRKSENGICKVAANKIRPQANPLSLRLTLSLVFSQDLGSELDGHSHKSC